MNTIIFYRSQAGCKRILREAVAHLVYYLSLLQQIMQAGLCTTHAVLDLQGALLLRLPVQHGLRHSPLICCLLEPFQDVQEICLLGLRFLQ